MFDDPGPAAASSLREAFENTGESTVGTLAEQDETDELRPLFAQQELADGVESQLGRLVDGETVDARADGRERDRPTFVLHGKAEAFVVHRRQQAALSLLSAAPDRSHRVKHEFCRQSAGRRHHGHAGRASLGKVSLRRRVNVRPPRPVNSAIHAASNRQLRIGSIDQCIDRLPGNVSLDEFNQAITDL